MKKILCLLFCFSLSASEITIHEGEIPSEVSKFAKEVFSENDHALFGKSLKGAPVSIALKDGDGNLVAAAIAEPFMGAFHLRNIVTKKEHRHKGYATILLEESEWYAMDRGYRFIFFETYLSEAVGELKRNGYEEIFVIDGFDHGLKYHYFKKML